MNLFEFFCLSHVSPFSWEVAVLLELVRKGPGKNYLSPNSDFTVDDPSHEFSGIPDR